MIPLHELAAWVKADEAEDADLLRGLEAAAVEVVQQRAGYVGPAREFVDELPYRGGVVELSEVPTGAVALEEWDGTDWVAVSAANFYTSGRLVYLTGNRLYVAPRRLRATYTAGLGENEKPPEWAKMAVRLLVAHWYTNREAVVVGATANDVPLGVDLLLQGRR